MILTRRDESSGRWTLNDVLEIFARFRLRRYVFARGPLSEPRWRAAWRDPALRVYLMLAAALGLATTGTLVVGRTARRGSIRGQLESRPDVFVYAGTMQP